MGKARTFNRRFQQMCSHYLVEPTACTPAAGWEKGQVENQVGSLRRRLFTPRPKVKTLDELNRWLEDACMAYARAARHPEFSDKTVWQVFEAERSALVPVGQPFDGFRESDVGVSKTCLIRFDRNRYSVKARAAGGSVQIRVYADKIVARLDGEVVAEHPRAFGRDRTVYDPLHYIPVLARKPGALRNGAPFREWRMPPGLTRVRARLGRGDDADRQFVGILAAIPENGLDAVEAACLQALKEGLHSRDAVLNILSRGKDIGPAMPPAAFNAPALRHEPVAACARYDRLRDREVARGAA
ncbi:Mobile element protein [Caenispirillum salinarum AK4]|uniref:Mobile element protein n=1 Tax=Caenispirillum salinarum AK4 TaxID=1238182 RepID=K9H7K8_9PROT|nr:Mobile element protein [Caenispirillum salinarum AK4]